MRDFAAAVEEMTIRVLGLLMLLLAPAAGADLAGHAEPAHYLAIGSVLAGLGQWVLWVVRSDSGRVAV